MKIKQVPISDLMKYVEEIYNEKHQHHYQHIFDIIDEYYSKITKVKSIKPYANTIFEDWCGLNFNTDINTCPNIPGIIVYKKNKNKIIYGLLYHSGSIISKEQQTEFLSYFYIDKNGQLNSHTYYLYDWDGWLAPTRYFYFNSEDYIDADSWYLGERVIKKGQSGHDIIILQKLLSQFFPHLQITGFFNEETSKALTDLQQFCNCQITNEFNFSSKEGQKLLNFLLNENKN